MRKAFSLVEVMVVLTLMLLLSGLAIWAFKDSNERDLLAKVRTDLIRIDSAKAAWRADHPQAATTDCTFDAIRGYLGLQPTNTPADFEPNAFFRVIYLLGAENEPASAARQTTPVQVFDRGTGTFR